MIGSGKQCVINKIRFEDIVAVMKENRRMPEEESKRSVVHTLKEIQGELLVI